MLSFGCAPLFRGLYTPPPIPVGLLLFQKVQSDSGRTNWIPVDSSQTNWNPVDFGGFQFVQLEMLDFVRKQAQSPIR